VQITLTQAEAIDMCPQGPGASMTIGSRLFLAHHPRANRAPIPVALRFVEIDFSWDRTKPARIQIARSAKLSSGCKDSPTNAFDEAPVASNQTLQLARCCPLRHLYEVRPRNDKRDVDLISDGLPFYAYHSGERARLAKNESL